MATRTSVVVGVITAVLIAVTVAATIIATDRITDSLRTETARTIATIKSELPAGTYFDGCNYSTFHGWSKNGEPMITTTKMRCDTND